MFYENKRLEVGSILRNLCEWKGVNIIEAEAQSQTMMYLHNYCSSLFGEVRNERSENQVCPDHIHLFVENDD